MIIRTLHPVKCPTCNEDKLLHIETKIGNGDNAYEISGGEEVIAENGMYKANDCVCPICGTAFNLYFKIKNNRCAGIYAE